LHKTIYQLSLKIIKNKKMKERIIFSMAVLLCIALIPVIVAGYFM